jgi:hypothetical protein
MPDLPDTRYLGTIQDLAGEPRPVYASIERHQCNACCRDGRHADLLFLEEHDVVTSALVQAVADLVSPGRPVLDVQPAPEVPLPDGYRTACLVTYGPLSASPVVAELEAER